MDDPHPSSSPRFEGYFDIVFDGPPGHTAGRFVEVEDEQGASIKIGEWIQDGDLWRLRIPRGTVNG